MVILSGPDEFAADALSPSGAVAPRPGGSEDASPYARKGGYPSPEAAQLTVATHNLLQVDAGWLSPQSAGWFAESKLSPPSGYVLVDKAPVSKLVKTPAAVLGVVLFPKGTGPGKTPTEAQIAAVIAAGKALKAKADLVVGISPWNMYTEKDLLPKLQDSFNCLFGGGEGIGFAHNVSAAAPSVLWLRSDSNGRAVTVLNIMELPPRGARSSWLEGVTFTTAMESLGQQYPPEPAMQRLVGDAPKQ